jgi:hypothetical protein
MNFLVRVPASGNDTGVVVMATGSGVDWKVKRGTIADLYNLAKNNARVENAELRLLHGANQPPAPVNNKLIYSANGHRFWVDTSPMAGTRFTANLTVVVQEVRTKSDVLIGYVVVAPDLTVKQVKVADLLAHCERERAAGRNAVQNMQYVSGSGSTAAHLKNFEGRTVPVYVWETKAVNAQVEAPAVAVPDETQAESNVQRAADIFSQTQLQVLDKGRTAGIDFKRYADPEYTPEHMNAIRRVLTAGKEPGLLFTKGIPNELLPIYAGDLILGIEIAPYFNLRYNAQQATQVKLGVMDNLEVSLYSDPAIDGNEMEQRRVRLKTKVWQDFE